MEESVTLVSGLFYLARTKWHHSGFPPTYDRYISWSENFLSLDSDIVIFVDDHYYDHVVTTRTKYDPELRRTKIIRRQVSDLELYKRLFFDIAKTMSSPRFKAIKHADCADNLYPLYNVVQYNKTFLLKEVAAEDPFQSTHFMWIDAGSTRETLSHYNGKIFPQNYELLNDKIIHFTHNTNFTMHDRQAYFLSQIRNIQGTAFVVPKHLVSHFNYLVYQELIDSLQLGYIGSDEKVYDAVYLRNPNIIHLVQCGWFKFFDIMNEEKKK